MGVKYTEQHWEDKKFKKEIGASGLQAYVLKRLRALPNLKAIKVMQSNESGVSDVLICYAGQYIAVELKVGRNKASALQLEFLDEIKSCGGVCGIAYDWGGVKKILRLAGYEFQEEI